MAKRKPSTTAREKSGAMGKGKGTGGIENTLAKMQKMWKGAEARRGYAPIPDGQYQAKLESAVIGNAKTSGRLQCTYVFCVLTPEEFEGKKVYKRDGLDSTENLEWFKGTLETLGASPEDIEDMPNVPNVLNDLVGTVAEITVQTKDEFQNVYINEVVEE